MDERHIVLDTETTGLNPLEGHRVIEIGCVELINRRLTGNDFHVYIQPERKVDAGAIAVHGITNEFLADQPRFAEISERFLNYVGSSELVIHNAPFDVGFLNHELQRLGGSVNKIDDVCPIFDTLVLARRLHPGGRASLDALCRRYDIDNSHRELHGALLDAQILADVYLLMTGGQSSLSLDSASNQMDSGERAVIAAGLELPVIMASTAEQQQHAAMLSRISAASNGSLWPADGQESGSADAQAAG